MGEQDVVVVKPLVSRSPLIKGEQIVFQELVLLKKTSWQTTYY